jgi:hypothetical protein
MDVKVPKRRIREGLACRFVTASHRQLTGAAGQKAITF